MQIGLITVDGMTVGAIEMNLSDDTAFIPDVQGYTPLGRAEGGLGGSGGGSGAPAGQGHHGHGGRGHGAGTPTGRDYGSGNGVGRPFAQGSAATDAAIARAAKEAGVNPDTMRGIASIESGMNPSSNANRSTQYKGLYQIGHDEWRRFGQGNIYSAEDNAMATARMFKENKRQFNQRYGRDPTDTELYLMHQQGLGFYTRGAMTNIGGNPYPGMHGPQTHESFEAGWGRELARRKAGFAVGHLAAPKPIAKSTADMVPDELFVGENKALSQPPAASSDETPDWAKKENLGDWANMRRSPDVIDRRTDDKTLANKKPLDLMVAKSRGREETAARDKKENHDKNQLSIDLGLGSLKKD